MAEERKYIVIKNFQEHQHYTDRNLIWIKLYVKLLRSDKFFNLKEDERWVYIGLLLLAAIKNNQIIYDLNFLKANICHYETTTEKLDEAIQRLVEEELVAIKLLSTCYQNAITDKNRVEENRIDKIRIDKKDIELTNLLYSLVKENYPFIINRKTDRQIQKDQEDMNKINRLDGRDYKIIEGVIRWSQQDEFWKQNIRSVNKLREKFDQLLVKINATVNKNKIINFDK